MKAVIMAGGEGSRLRPLTSNRPKPLVPVVNVPIMEHIVALLKRHGITEIVATLHYRGDEIRSYFGDGRDFGVKFEYFVERFPLGTAGAVKMAEDSLRNGPFLIISGDALTDADLSAAIQFHSERQSQATLVLAHVPNPLDFGVVITAPDGRIERFLEKPSWTEVFSDTVNTGMYVIEPRVLDLLERERVTDWSADIFPAMLEARAPLFGYVMDGYWADIGSLSQYREAQEDMLAGQVGLHIPGTPLRPGIYQGPNCVIESGARLVAPVCLGRSVKIKSGAVVGPMAVLGDHVLVEQDARIESSVVWEHAYIGSAVDLSGAIIGARATLKQESSVQEDAVVGDRCTLGEGATVKPRIKLWPDKVVEPGATVTMSLVWGSRWRGSLFGDLGVSGLSNIEITPEFATRLGSAFGSGFGARTKVVTCRDSTRSSRMIKRAMIASLLSVGCDVLDLRGIALPIARHFIKNSPAAGAVNVRKLPGNSRVTLIEMLDGDGLYLPRNRERKVESAFFREDYVRTDPDDLGVIEFASRAIEEYQADFFRQLSMATTGRRLRIVCDYGYSSLAAYFPAMLGRLGIENISLNGYNDAKMAPRSSAEVETHSKNLSSIVETLGYDMGVLFTEEGERVFVIDRFGETLSGTKLFGLLGALIAETQPSASVAMSLTQPVALERFLEDRGVTVIRTRPDVRSLMEVSQEQHVNLAGDGQGAFIHPRLHAGFDAPYSLALLLTMLQSTGLDLTDVAQAIPDFPMGYEMVSVPQDQKGALMRKLREEPGGEPVPSADGVRIARPDGWTLVLPDASGPEFHVYAEGEDGPSGRRLAAETANRLRELVAYTSTI